MKASKTTLFRFILQGIIFPVTMSIVVYTGFSTNYSTNVFSKQAFENQYQSGVYRYRVLGKAILLETYDLIKNHQFPTEEAPYALNSLDPNGDKLFYSAYLYMNTFFLCLASMVLFFILNRRDGEQDLLVIDLSLLFICFIMTTTQYAVVPYDTLSYFFLVIAILLIIRKYRSWWSVLALGIVVILSTLTRETSFFILLFYLVHNYDAIQEHAGLKINSAQATFLFISACFLISYVGLRLALGYQGTIINSFSDAFRFMDNLRSFHAILGMVYILSFIALFFTTKAAAKEMSLFVKFSSPYILFILLSANPWEIRLWTPLILILLVMKVRAHQPQNLLSQNIVSV